MTTDTLARKRLEVPTDNIRELDQNIKGAANKFLVVLEEHIAAPRHVLEVAVVYALLTHYKDVVPVMPKLVIYATMNSSGKSTLAQAVMDVGNFAPMSRKITKLSAAGIIRLADETKQGVPIEDAHRFWYRDNIFYFIVNSFPMGGVHLVADQKNQKKFITYEIGGTPIVVTTNAVSKLDQDALRRSIQIPMIRKKPKKKFPKALEAREKLFAPFWETFKNGAIHGAALVEEHLDDPMPDWIGEDQKDRWAPMFAVTRALLGPDWEKRLEEAARRLEDVTYTPNEVEQLLTDIWEIRSKHPKTIGITPATLYEELHAINADQWSEMSPTRLGRKVKDIRDGDGRKLVRLNIPTSSQVAGDWRAGAKYFPWSHFEAAWEAYGINRRCQSKPVCLAAA